MNNSQFRTKGILLRRVDYGEADRIVTFLTPTHGKVGAMVKGARKVKSKLAGGIELFSVSDITLLQGRKNLDQLISARLIIHYGDIIKNMDRTLYGYEILKIMDRVTEEASGVEHFEVLQQTMRALGDLSISLGVVKVWFGLRLLHSLGHMPELSVGEDVEKDKFLFDFEAMSFVRSQKGIYVEDHIKVLRLASKYGPEVIQRVQGVDKLLPPLDNLLQRLVQMQTHR